MNFPARFLLWIKNNKIKFYNFIKKNFISFTNYVFTLCKFILNRIKKYFKFKTPNQSLFFFVILQQIEILWICGDSWDLYFVFQTLAVFLHHPEIRQMFQPDWEYRHEVWPMLIFMFTYSLILYFTCLFPQFAVQQFFIGWVYSKLIYYIAFEYYDYNESK